MATFDKANRMATVTILGNPKNSYFYDAFGQRLKVKTAGTPYQLQISDPELTELANKPVRVDGDGSIDVPLAGRVHVGGLTAQQGQQELNKALSTYIRRPQVIMEVSEVHSQPVSVLGAVNTPGVHQVQGHKTLLETLALAGGIRQDAGYSVRITRELAWGCIPLPGAHLDPTGQFTIAELNLKKIMDAKTPEENIQILPHDVISVPKAEMGSIRLNPST